ncbi:MAG: hypothetical protein AB1634_19445 [Thermodesulfobacteriota bacterium]
MATDNSKTDRRFEERLAMYSAMVGGVVAGLAPGQAFAGVTNTIHNAAIARFGITAVDVDGDGTNDIRVKCDSLIASTAICRAYGTAAQANEKFDIAAAAQGTNNNYANVPTRTMSGAAPANSAAVASSKFGVFPTIQCLLRIKGLSRNANYWGWVRWQCRSNTTGGQLLDSAWTDSTASNCLRYNSANAQGQRGEDCGAGAVDLTAFTAAGAPAGITLSWQTATEVDHAGFHIWRAPAGSDAFAQVSCDLIPGQGDAAQGFAYQFQDPAVEPGQGYWYKLEAVDSQGGREFFGPVGAVAGPGVVAVAPATGSPLPLATPPTFSWLANGPGYFWLDFAARPSFRGGKRLLLGDGSPAQPITGTGITLSPADWTRLQQHFRLQAGDYLFWRVLGLENRRKGYASEGKVFQVE